MRDVTTTESTAAAGTDDMEKQSRMAALVQARLTLIERRLTSPLTEDRRARLLAVLSEPRTSWNEDEIACVPDGTEPGIIFRPLTPEAAMRQEVVGHE
jgi:hypothetical protein